jgi:hypothetical protein
MERNSYEEIVKVENILQEEPFASHIANGLYSAMDIEQAVLTRESAEQESVDIQHMIAQFYNKFDELHEKSLMSALASQPNRTVIKNEVKYRIPDRWTKKFNKHDIVSLDLLKGSGIENE